MKNDMDAQFLCKDCARHNECQFYDRRKEDSYICKYFHLVETDMMPNGMTNEDVLNNVLRQAFPRLIFIRGVNELNKTKSIVYSEEWAERPYRKDE
jgi:hypothetical protein